MKCIIYCRKSTSREDKQAVSIEHQRETCRRVSIMNNLEVVEEILEEKSAKESGKRPEFLRMINRCKKG